MAAAEEEEEKVFVALPAEFKAGQSTLSWALSHFAGGGSTIVIAHVHVPSKMIPVMEFDVDVKCEKLVFENDDVVAGLIDLIASHGVTKLVISAAADKHYSRKMDKPKSKTAIEVMQRADPSCQIWFVCKGQLICTRDQQEVEISSAKSMPLISPERQSWVAFGSERAKPRDDETPVTPIKRRPKTANSQTATRPSNRPSPPPAKMPPSPPESETEPEFVELDPTGRYGRYTEVLGKGAFKTVYPFITFTCCDVRYKAFDQLEGLEVAWNQIKVGDLLRNNDDLERLRSEVRLLKTLKHKNIIKFYNSWLDKKNNNINFITEVFTSGTLRQFVLLCPLILITALRILCTSCTKSPDSIWFNIIVIILLDMYRIKHKKVDIRALKKWSRQILSGLYYLHSHDPPVIHRDLKCDNIFVNGNQGEVKIGDLGLATILDHARSAHSIIGTPEFMAPELYDEEYNELVDIYAFGMCLLELVTFEYPYCECSNAAQIYKKVTDGEKPSSLAKIDDPQVKFFIEKCIAKAPQRLSAKDLLLDPFLLDVDDEKIFYPLHQNNNAPDTAGNSNPSTSYRYDRVASIGRHDHTGSITGSRPSGHYIHDSMDPHAATGRIITVESQRKDLNTIFLKLRIADSTGHAQNIHFPFDIEADTSISVATEMVVQLDLTDQDVTAIAEMIDAEIRAHIPDWAVEESMDNQGDEAAHSETHSSDDDEGTSELRDEPDAGHNGFVQEQLPSGRKYWSDSPRRDNEIPPLVANPQTGDSVSNGIVKRSDVDDRIDGGVSVGTSPHSSEVEGQCISADVTERLENLLAQQQEELNALQRKHKADIEAILNSVPTEDREETLTRCRLKVDQKNKANQL
ncbi:hypothetical protein EJB05_34452 [Eragrostis curvula]|uniref:non-specific serine/threonine protein kinase n=2 Tax=Magnoliopsida TaxID=3398 RepID=A0A5J9SL00_9POAL|nr:hypothetical protein EJB05_54950 [Eragrostis curvula]TVU18361.1 hypothetical protein EJB05_34452 [Eragrostis curvula]